jgi:hypothetical protein
VTQLSHLERREIQAPVAACLIRAFAKEIGSKRALEIAASAIRMEATTAGARAAENYGDDSLAALSRFIREVWTDDGALTIRFIEETDRRLRFDVIRCRYAELYDRMGMKDLGACLSCNRDEPFAAGFNSRIRMERTGTIMEEAPVCDFCFTLD